MHDLFIGTWKLNPGKSRFDPNHRPTEGTMRWERDSEGAYLMHAMGTNAKGDRIAERPQRLVVDGKPYPVEGFAGLVSITRQPDTHTIHALVQREDGSIAGEGTYAVDSDGRTMTATTAGFDTQLRRFETQTVWDRT